MKKHIKLAAVLAAAICTVTVTAATGCNADDKTIRIGATPTPHAEILKDVVKDLLEEKGYTLEVVEFTDYVLPNLSVEDGDLDANYFQHIQYLEEFNDSRGTHLKEVARVHYEPFAIYRGDFTGSQLTDLPDGAKIAVPNDATNEARALFLLEAQGLITLNENASLTGATKLDIAYNPKNFEIVELEAKQISSALPDVAIGVINGNYALGAGLDVNDALAREEATDKAVEQYINVIAVKEGHENDDKIKALTEAVLSQEVKDYIAQKYSGAVIAAF